MKELFELFVTFLKIGGLTFGGGYVMLPIIQKEVVDIKGWATDSEIVDCFAVAQCTPGAISVNAASLIGYRRRGIPGAIFSTAGLVLPSLVIIIVIASFIQNFSELPAVKSAFAGIRVVVAVFVVNAVIRLLKSTLTDKICGCIFALSFIAAAFLNVSPILIIVFASIAGIVLKGIGGKKS
jgi:chromate transporter